MQRCSRRRGGSKAQHAEPVTTPRTIQNKIMISSTQLAPGQDLLPGALFVQLLRGLDGLEPPPEGLGRELCYLGAVEEDDGRVVDPHEDDDHGASGAIDGRARAL